MNASAAPSSSPAAASGPANNPYADFQAGVTAALRSWSALRTAVEQSWGGGDSAAKAESLRSNVFVVFDGSSPNPKMGEIELEEELLGYMEEEFGVVLEDGSERELASLIVQMYESCGRGEVALAREVVRNAMAAEVALGKSDVKSVIRAGDDDMDDDDSDAEGAAPMEGEGAAQPMNGEMHDATKQADAALAYASGTLFGGPPKPKKELPPPRQLGEPEPEKPPPVVDDDGFAPVVTKKKGKKR